MKFHNILSESKVKNENVIRYKYTTAPNINKYIIIFF